MKAPLYSKQGNKKGEVVLNPEVFGSRVNERLLELVRNAYSANLRHGTADTKTRKEVQGGGKKPWKQKGTGRARASSIRSPIWKGGGVVFGPHPRSYFVNMPKGMRLQALISALSLRGEQKNLMLLEDVKLESAKTREWAEIVNALPLEKKKTLCVVKDFSENLNRACRNLENWVEVRRAKDINAYHILQREKLVIEQDAVSVIEGRLFESGGAKPEAEAAEGEKKAGVRKKSVRGSARKTTSAAAKKAPAAKKQNAKSGKKKS